MASIWIQKSREKPPEKVAGHLSVKAVKREAAKMLRAIIATNKHAKQFKIVADGEEFFMFNNEQFIGSLWIEYCSPPSKSDGFDGRRNIEPA